MDVLEDAGLVTIDRYFSPFEADAYRMALEQAGIRAWVFSEPAGTTFLIGVGTRLEVAAQDESAARAVLAAQPPLASEEAAGPPAEAERSPAPSPSDEPDRLRSASRLELCGVLLVTSVYPILRNVLDKRSTRNPAPIPLSELAIGALWYLGLTFVFWRLLQRERGPLSPASLPASAAAWVREIVFALLILGALWILDGRLNPWLRFVGVPNAPSPWAPTLRQAGIAMVWPLHTLFTTTYEEIVFRAYYISRLPLLLGERPIVSLLVAAALFALSHGYGWRSTALILLDGVAYGGVYLASRSLPRLVVAHWLHNVAVMALYMRGG